MLETPKKQTDSTPGTAEKAIIHALPLGIIAFDSTLKIFEANSQAKALIKPGKYIDASLAEGTEADIWGDWKDRLSEVIKSGKTLTLNKVRYKFRDAQQLLNIICTPLRGDSDDKITGAVMVVEDITKKANIENQLANKSQSATRLASLILRRAIRANRIWFRRPEIPFKIPHIRLESLQIQPCN